jgi:hypothetical protein
MGNSVKAANYKVIASCLRWRFSNSSTGNKTTSQCIPVLPTRHHAPKPAAPKNVVIGHSQPCHLQFIPSKPSAHGYDDMNPTIGNKFIDVTSAKRETGKALPPSRPNKHFQHVLAFWCLLLTLHSACATPPRILGCHGRGYPWGATHQGDEVCMANAADVRGTMELSILGERLTGPSFPSNHDVRLAPSLVHWRPEPALFWHDMPPGVPSESALERRRYRGVRGLQPAL